MAIRPERDAERACFFGNTLLKRIVIHARDACFSAAAVAAPHGLAAEAGRAILAEGGNALEAMVAMAATIAVAYPHMNAVGGDAFWLVREPGGRVRAIEACGPAGSLATIKRYRDKGYDAIPPRGPDAALTVAGAVGGWQAALDYARSLGAKIPLSVLLTDAVRLAREGCPVSVSEARGVPNEAEALHRAPGFAETFLVDGKTPPAGTVRKRPALADTLAHLAGAGLDDFYRGDVGREIAADLERIGSPVTRGDLEAFRARTVEPLSLRLPSVTLYNFPPPTQGLAALLILGIHERLGIRPGDVAAHHHGLVEAVKRAVAIRDRVCTDPAFLRHDPADFLAPAALAREAARIDGRKAARFPLRHGGGRHGVDGRDRRRRARRLLHPVDLLGMGLRLRPAADRHPLAEPRRLVLARCRGRRIRWRPAAARSTR